MLNNLRFLPYLLILLKTQSVTGAQCAREFWIVLVNA